MNLKKLVIVGRAGSGKTTTLLKMMENRHPENTLFLTFTRKASWEAKERAIKKWGLEKKEVRYFGTFHKICYRLLDYSPDMLLKSSEIKEFFDKEKIDFSPNLYINLEDLEKEEIMPFFGDEAENIPPGNKLLALKSWIEHTRAKSIKDLKKEEIIKAICEWQTEKNELFNSIFKLSTPESIYNFLMEYEDFKGGRADYEDILLNFLEDPYVPEEIRYLFVDEGQDLSELMKEVVLKILSSGRIEEYFLAGDDLQRIYAFMGASKYFENEVKDAYKNNYLLYLNKSFRLKKNIWDFYTRFILSNINYPQELLRLECQQGGKVIFPVLMGDYQYFRFFKNFEDKNTFLLTRTNFLKEEWKRKLRELGIFFLEEGLGENVWTPKMIRIYNALIKLKNNIPIDYSELLTLIENIYQNPFLYWGIKTKLKKGELKDTLYSFGGEAKYSKEYINKVFFQKPYNVDYVIKNLPLMLDKKDLKTIEIKLIRNPTLIDTNNCIRIGTIHSVKGAEADFVILDARINKRIKEKIFTPEGRIEETAIFGVGITRAKQELYVINFEGNPLFSFYL